MENVLNHQDLTIFRSLLLPLLLQRGNNFLIYFSIQYYLLTVSNVFEAICCFLNPKNKGQLKGQNYFKFQGK